MKKAIVFLIVCFSACRVNAQIDIVDLRIKELHLPVYPFQVIEPRSVFAEGYIQHLQDSLFWLTDNKMEIEYLAVCRGKRYYLQDINTYLTLKIDSINDVSGYKHLVEVNVNNEPFFLLFGIEDGSSICPPIYKTSDYVLFTYYNAAVDGYKCYIYVIAENQVYSSDFISSSCPYVKKIDIKSKEIFYYQEDENLIKKIVLASVKVLK